MRSASVLLVLVVAAGCRSVEAPGAFHRRDLPVGASLRGLAAVDADVAWVGGSGGALWRTTDGGATWSHVAPHGAEACDFRDVEAFDRDTAVAMVAGQPARVYRTEDGGANWRIVHEDPDPAAFFDAIAFDGARGVLFGDPRDAAFALLVSDDGGRTWRDAPDGTLPRALDGEAAFAASGSCVAPIGGGRFALATGGGGCRHVAFAPGTVPDVRALPLGGASPSSGAFSVAWRAAAAIVVGGDYAAPAERTGSAAWTDDGGVTWHEADALGFRSAVLWLDGERALAVGSHGQSWSPDGGRTWRPLDGPGFHALARGRDGSVWACGSDGRVGRLAPAR